MEHRGLFNRVGRMPIVFVLFVSVVLGVSASVSGETCKFRVKLQINKPYCLLNFMDTLKTRGYYGPTLYGHYKKSKYNEDEKLSKLVQQYSSVKISYRYSFDEYPKYRYMVKNRATSDIFFNLSARTENLEEFKQMTVGIIPFENHQRLFNILEAVEPIYDELVWNPYYSKAQARLKALKEYAEKVKLDEMLGPIAHFLNSSWSTDIPIIVSFSIVPGEKIRLVPPPIGNVIRAGLLTESEDYSWYVGLIVHEFSHKAFAEQPLKMHQQIDQLLTESKSPHRGTVNLMFNEVLGGAIGHKVREDLLGKAHEFTYNQAAVKAMDEAVYPMVVSYLNEGKSIDRAFVNECLALYEKTFPNALYEYQSLFQVYYLLTDVEGSQGRTLPRMMRKNIVGPMMYEVGSGITDENIDALMAYEFTKVIVITKDHEKTIKYLKGKITALDRFDSLDAGSDWVLSCHDADRNPYVVVNIQSPEAFEEVTKKLKEIGVIDPAKPIVFMGE
ncbi:MAG: hypothetical protein GY845_00960 [Planctomycetes bacterium]|nr:hypothetical protein [Planctomycetota bacterium]